MNGVSWLCGHCEHFVNSTPVYSPMAGRSSVGFVLVCPRCHGATLQDTSGRVYPPAPAAGLVNHLPPDVERSWAEARLAYGAGAYTAAEIMCRKILMHLAVDTVGSNPGKTFVSYVDDLDAAGYVAPGLKPKVTEIKNRGNIANHDIPASTQADAEKTMQVTRYLLQSIYELPNT